MVLILSFEVMNICLIFENNCDALLDVLLFCKWDVLLLYKSIVNGHCVI